MNKWGKNSGITSINAEKAYHKNSTLIHHLKNALLN